MVGISREHANETFSTKQLMQQVNTDGIYATFQAVLPHFGSNNWIGQIIVVSP
jgi:NADP-dependent 3-hydroxy acid dehydrogenase YdfG